MSTCPCCGYNLSAKAKPRSLEQHKRYFALINAAYAQWPEMHDFKPDNVDHLRRWLQCKAGYYETRSFQLPETDNPATMARMMEFAEALLETQPGTRFGRWIGSTLAVFIPKSIAFEKLPHKDACRLFDDVAGFIEDAIGVPAEQLLRERAA